MNLLAQLAAGPGVLPPGLGSGRDPGALGLRVVADALLALAYLSVPVALFVFAWRRRDLPARGVIACLAGLGAAGGTMHLFEIWTIWHPAYWLSGGIKAATAAAAIPAAILLVKALSVPGPAALTAANAELRSEIDRHRLTEEALRESEDRMRLVFESVRDYAIIRLDPDGRVASWNAGAERIKGYPAGEIIGQNFARFYPEAVARDGFPARALAQAAADGRFEDEGWRVRRDGTQFWANVVITALRDRDGRLVGFVKVTRDITDRRRAEDEIRNLNADLQKHAGQVEAANRELEAFSYSVSHDLRAPLRHIDGFAGMLRQELAPETDPKVRRHLTVISDAARQMGRLIDDLLAFSRMGRVPLNLAPVDHNALVAAAVSGADGSGRGAPATWQVSPLPPVRADPAMLRQVWANLVDNAVKYSARAPAPRIEIGSGSDRASGDTVFFIRDNGAGFDMRHAGKLFQVFQRLHATGEFEGTGVGLATVRRIVERHGGRVWAEGRPGEGATFYFTLPRPAGPGDTRCDRDTDHERNQEHPAGGG